MFIRDVTIGGYLAQPAFCDEKGRVYFSICGEAFHKSTNEWKKMVIPVIYMPSGNTSFRIEKWTQGTPIYIQGRIAMVNGNMTIATQLTPQYGDMRGYKPRQPAGSQPLAQEANVPPAASSTPSPGHVEGDDIPF